LKGYKNQIEEKRKSISSKEGELEEIYRRLSINDDYAAMLLSKEPDIESMQKEIVTYDNEVSINGKDLERLAKETYGKEPADLSSFDSKIDEIDNAIKAMNSRITILSSRLATNRNAMDTIEKASKDVAELSKKRQDIKEIADVASGAIGDKMSFETFIQSLYFKRVLHFANLRMKKMTSGRYELIPRVDTKDGRSKFGLDIDVSDNYTGRSRSNEPGDESRNVNIVSEKTRSTGDRSWRSGPKTQSSYSHLQKCLREKDTAVDLHVWNPYCGAPPPQLMI
jgi:exonuclease SbcC